MAAGIYVHIPFCLKKCFYCDFFSKPIDDAALRKAFAEALLREIAFYGQKYGKKLAVDTIFFGGGTPSLMEPGLMSAILDGLREAFDVAPDAEITAECNPATLTPEKLEGYRTAGINRLSIGVQSFDDKILARLGRIHRAADAIDTVAMARAAGFDNINLDLMFAVPGQGIGEWRESLKQALALKPEHLSFYSLEICENTVFDKLFRTGELQETPIEEDRRMYSIAMEETEKAGYEHYEISNAALPGRECRHNLKYWAFEEYLGLGPSAHSFMDGERFSNIRDIEKYLAAGAGEAVESRHQNTFEDSVSEYVFTALRTKRGVVFADFAEKFGREFWDVYAEQRSEFEEFVRGGFAFCGDSRIALTRKGIDVSNRIMAMFV